MRRFLVIVLSVVAAALAAPVTFLLLAAALNAFGWRGFATEVERLPFRTSGYAAAAIDFMTGNESLSLIPWIAVITAGLIFAFFLSVFLRSAFRHTRGPTLVVSCGLATIPIYIYLCWDGPAVHFQSEQLVPGRGLTHVPREVVLECSKDPTYGRVKDWPKTEFEFHKDSPTNEWLLKNADQIRLRWTQLEPVRAWAAKIDQWQSFDDYVGKLTDPILSFQPLRQLTYGAQEYALLCGAENKPEAAAAVLAANVRLARHLEQGSRTLVTLMIGIVIEKSALRTFNTLADRFPENRVIYTQALSPATVDMWSDFERTLRNEVLLGSTSIRDEYTGGARLKTRVANHAIRPLLNLNATAHIYQDYIEQVIADAKHGDFEAFDRKESDPRSDVSRYHFKNPTGHLLARMAPTAFGKIAQNIADLEKLRSEFLTRPTGG